MPATVAGRPPASLTVGGGPGLDVRAAAALAASVAALVAPYLALATSRAALDATQSLLSDAMPPQVREGGSRGGEGPLSARRPHAPSPRPQVVANMVERQALGLADALLRRELGDGGGRGGAPL